MPDTPARAVPQKLKGKGAFVITALVLLAVGAVYYMYVREKRSYLESRNLRLLASASAQLNQTLASTRTLVGNFAKGESWRDPHTKQSWPESYQRNPRTTQWLDGFLGDISDIRRDVVQRSDPFGSEQFRQTLRRDNDRLMLEVEYVGAMPPGSGATPANVQHAVAHVPLDDMLARLYDIEFYLPFESLLLVRGDGTVLYQVQPAKARRVASLGRIAPVLNAATAKSNAIPADLMVASLASVVENVGFNTERQLDLGVLSDETQQTEVKIAGATYILASQPLRFEAPASPDIPEIVSEAAKANKNDANATAAQRRVDRLRQWTVCGLVPRSRFMGEATAVSASTVALGVGFLLIVICTVPLLKLALLGEHQPITRADAMLTAIAMLLAVGIGTLMLSDWLASSRVNELADEQQSAYATTLKRTLYQGIDRLFGLSDDLQKWSNAYVRQRFPGAKEMPEAGVGDIVKENLNDAGIDESLRNSGLYLQADAAPWFSSFAFIDNDARHRFRGQLKFGTPPLLPLTNRPYVREVQERPWLWHPQSGKPRPFYIDSGRTLTTGKPETVFAVPTNRPDVPVFAITTPFIQLARPLATPGLTFAIIDARGSVLYHSDPQRIGIENVFAETDYDRQLRAVVFSRHQEFVDARYWGHDQRVLVTPLGDLPWTLLTFRDKRLLRTINVEALAMTLMLFGTYVMLWVLLMLLVGGLRPRYRAPWLWPDPARAAAWIRLRWVHAGTIAAFALVLFYATPTVRLAAAILLPAQAALASCLVLHPARRRIAYALTWLLWAMLTGALLFGALSSRFEEELLPANLGWIVRLGIFAFIAVAAALTIRRGLGDDRKIPSREYAFHYVSSGLLTVIIIAALPMVGFFQTALRIEMESVVKYGQLLLADALQQRTEDLAKDAWIAAPQRRIARSYLMPQFFESFWCMQKNLPVWQRGTEKLMPENPVGPPCYACSSADRDDAPDPDVTWTRASNEVAELLEEWLPLYSEDSTSMRRLHHDAALDGSWKWLRSGRAITLIRRLNLSKDATTKLAFNDNKDRSLVIVSRLPWIAPRALVPRDAIGDFPTSESRPNGAPRPHFFLASAFHTAQVPTQLRAAGILLLVLLLLTASYAMVEFVARKIFVYDVRTPSWLDTRSPLKGALVDNLLIIYGGRPLSDLVDETGFIRLSFKDLHARNAWTSELSTIEQSADGRSILCSDLDHLLEDETITEQTLKFLERLLLIPCRTTLLATRVSPTLLWSRTAADKDRWPALLSAFIWIDNRHVKTLPPASMTLPAATKVHAELQRASLRKEIVTREFWTAEWRRFTDRMSRLADALGLRPQPESNATWIADEIQGHAYIAEVSRSVPLEGSRQQVADELAERTDSYYGALWSSCSHSERVLLSQIARYGFVNGTDRRVLRRLLARNLVVRGGDIRIFNETFRRYVLTQSTAVLKETAALENADSPWDRLRAPLGVALIIVSALLVTTQKELASQTSAIVTGIAAGLPALVKLMGIFADRKGVSATRE